MNFLLLNLVIMESVCCMYIGQKDQKNNELKYEIALKTKILNLFGKDLTSFFNENLRFCICIRNNKFGFCICFVEKS